MRRAIVNYGEGQAEILTKKLTKSVLLKRLKAAAERPASYYMPVKKAELAGRLAEKMGVTKKQGVEWLDAFVDEVTKVMRSGDKVNITGFGIFKVSDRKAREGRNPRTGETIHIAASKKPRFTPGKLLKEAIKQ